MCLVKSGEVWLCGFEFLGTRHADCSSGRTPVVAPSAEASLTAHFDIVASIVEDSLTSNEAEASLDESGSVIVACLVIHSSVYGDACKRVIGG
jgi:hypothetical protein